MYYFSSFEAPVFHAFPFPIDIWQKTERRKKERGVYLQKSIATKTKNSVPIVIYHFYFFSIITFLWVPISFINNSSLRKNLTKSILIRFSLSIIFFSFIILELKTLFYLVSFNLQSWCNVKWIYRFVVMKKDFINPNEEIRWK